MLSFNKVFNSLSLCFVYQWCEFKSRRGKNKNLTAQRSNSNTVWFNFQTYIYIYILHGNQCTLSCVCVAKKGWSYSIQTNKGTLSILRLRKLKSRSEIVKTYSYMPVSLFKLAMTFHLFFSKVVERTEAYIKKVNPEDVLYAKQMVYLNHLLK